MAGLDVVDICGMGYNPILQNYHLNENVSVNYMVACCPKYSEYR